MNEEEKIKDAEMNANNPSDANAAPEANGQEPTSQESPSQEATEGTEEPVNNGEGNKMSMMAFFAKRYPDVKGKSADDYYDKVNGDYEGYDKMKKDSESMSNLISSDPRIAKMLTGMSSGKDENGDEFSIEKFLFENYGDEIQSAKDSEEAIAMIQQRKQKELEAKAKQEEHDKRVGENLKKADIALDEAVKEGGYSADEAKKMIAYLYDDKKGLLVRAMSHDLSKEDFAGLLLAANAGDKMKIQHDAGYKEAMNKRIDMEKHHKEDRASMPADIKGSSSEPDRNANPTIAAMSRVAKNKWNY